MMGGPRATPCRCLSQMLAVHRETRRAWCSSSATSPRVQPALIPGVLAVASLNGYHAVVEADVIDEPVIGRS